MKSRLNRSNRDNHNEAHDAIQLLSPLTLPSSPHLKCLQLNSCHSTLTHILILFFKIINSENHRNGSHRIQNTEAEEFPREEKRVDPADCSVTRSFDEGSEFSLGGHFHFDFEADSGQSDL